MPNDKRKRDKLAGQIVLLAVIALLAIGMYLYSNWGKLFPPPPAAAKSIETGYNEKVLDKLKQNDTSYPQVNPAKNELGKADPFAP